MRMPVGKFNLESNAMKLRKGCSNRGADMGRPSFMPLIDGQPLTMKVWEMVIDDGGYDQGGAYWGLRLRGEKIFFAESLESVHLARYCRPDKGTVEMTCDALNWHDAWDKIKKRLPGAKLCPVKWVSRCDKALLRRLYYAGFITPGSKSVSEWGRAWPYVRPLAVDADQAFASRYGGYKHIFRIRKVSDIAEGAFILEEKIYNQPRTTRKTKSKIES
jgi:hypothetical protein